RDIATKEERHAALVQELASIPSAYDAARHADARTRFERLAPMAQRAASLTARLEREATVADEALQVRTRLAASDARGDELEAKRAATPFSEESFAEMRARYEAAAAELRAAELTAVAARVELGAAEAALETANRAGAELTKSEQRLAGLTADRRLHEELD